MPPAADGSRVRTSAVQTCLAELSMEIEGDFSACEDVGRAAGRDSGLSQEDLNPEAAAWKSGAQGPGFDEDLQAAVDFFRLPPPLLSPVPSPPLASPPHLGVSPSLLAPVSGYCVLASPGAHLVHPDTWACPTQCQGGTRELARHASAPGVRILNPHTCTRYGLHFVLGVHFTVSICSVL